MNKVYQIVMTFSTDLEDWQETYDTTTDLAEAHEMLDMAMTRVAEVVAEFEAEHFYDEVYGNACIIAVGEDGSIETIEPSIEPDEPEEPAHLGTYYQNDCDAYNEVCSAFIDGQAYMIEMDNFTGEAKVSKTDVLDTVDRIAYATDGTIWDGSWKAEMLDRIMREAFQEGFRKDGTVWVSCEPIW